MNICHGRISQLQVHVAQAMDLRIRDTMEMLTGMRTIKLNSMESRFVAAVCRQRQQESLAAAATQWWYAFANTTSSNSVVCYILLSYSYV